LYETDGPREYGKWRLGDEVTCIRESDGKMGFGKILEIHPECADGEAYFTFCCEMIGSFQLSKFSSIIEKLSKSQKKKRSKARIDLINELNK
jgi:hypothetical protein